ncbi:MAG: hypothetical protein ACNA77_03080 [Opitutales bacterium]
MSRLLCLFLFPLALSANELRDYLQQYEGRWVGQFSIHSTANGYTESFPVEQRYWWKDEVLHGLAVLDRKSGIETTTSKTWVEGEKFISEVKRGKTVEAFFGVLHDGVLLWLPTDMGRANDYQIREFFVVEEGLRKLKVEGFDTYVFGEGLAHIIFKGKLQRQREAEGAGEN